MIILMKGLNEEYYVKRCISDFHDEPFVDRIIVIDGKSTDLTVHELKKFSKVEVYVHEWLADYHDNEISQSNIALSYVPKNAVAFILDFDERMSPELKLKLNEINENQDDIPEAAIIHFSRRTFELVRYEGSPHAIIDEDGWPIISHQIGSYPDYQARLIRKSAYMHWINSPHHVLSGANHSSNIDADIIHYEKSDSRHRRRIEIGWARCQAMRKKLGLRADVFETDRKIEIAEFYDEEAWK